MKADPPANLTRNPPVRRSLWRRWRIWFLLLAVVAGLVAYQQWEAWKGEAELRAVLAQWDQQGPWRWKEWLAGRPSIPDGENGALIIDQMAQLKPKHLDTDLSLALFGYELDHYPQHVFHDEQLKELRSRVAKCQAALALFPEYVKRKETVWPVQEKITPFALPFTGVDRSRELLNLVHDQFELHVHDGKLKEACEQLNHGLLLHRNMDHQLTLLGRLVQLAFVQQTCSRIQRLLALSEPDDALLSQLQQELLRFDEQRSWKKTLLVESGSMEQTIQDMHQNKFDISNFWGLGMNGTGSWWNQQVERVNMYFQTRAMLSARQHAECLQMMFTFYQHADEPWSQQAKQWKSIDDRMKQEREQGRFRLAHILMPAMHKIGQSEMQTMAKLRTTRVALAAERFRRKENRWPVSQDELTGRFLEKVLVDPFDDQPLRMKRTEDGLVIYSIGKNEKDNGGFVLPSQEEGQPLDVGIKLWDVPQRRRPARPLPEDYLNRVKELKTAVENDQ